MVNSRQKGSAGEREAAKLIKDLFGVDARRGQQFSGGGESPDIVTGIDELHFEVKRVETLHLYKAIEQSKRDAGEDKIPCVLHRKSRQKWLFIVEAENLPELIKKVNKYV